MKPKAKVEALKEWNPQLGWLKIEKSGRWLGLGQTIINLCLHLSSFLCIYIIIIDLNACYHLLLSFAFIKFRFCKKIDHHPIQPPPLLNDLLGLDYLDFTHHSMAILYAPLLVSKQTIIHKHTQGK